MQCLEANIHKSGVSGGCKSTLKSRMKKEHSNYQLNVELKKVENVLRNQCLHLGVYVLLNQHRIPKCSAFRSMCVA